MGKGAKWPSSGEDLSSEVDHIKAGLKLSTYKNWLWHLNGLKTLPLLSSPSLSSPSDLKGGASGGGGKGVTAALRRRRTGTVDPATVTCEGGGSGDGEMGVHPARTAPTWSIGHDLNGLEYLE
uniref:Uncharacterized protein n=1 Tax=Oryza barthii TaxID=65489 RepID=A0A0D3HD33_9ORYZ